MQQPNITIQKKLDLATEIGHMEIEIAKQENAIKDLEQRRASAKSNRTAGAAALLIGILLAIFLNGVWYLGAFLIVIGGLTLFTAMSKQGSAEVEIRKATNTVVTLRDQLAEKRATLSVL